MSRPWVEGGGLRFYVFHHEIRLWGVGCLFLVIAGRDVLRLGLTLRRVFQCRQPVPGGEGLPKTVSKVAWCKDDHSKIAKVIMGTRKEWEISIYGHHSGLFPACIFNIFRYSSVQTKRIRNKTLPRLNIFHSWATPPPSVQMNGESSVSHNGAGQYILPRDSHPLTPSIPRTVACAPSLVALFSTSVSVRLSSDPYQW